MSTFIKRFNSLTRIEYNPNWGNGTGYYDFAVSGQHAPSLNVGQQVAALSDNGRRIIITGTPVGNLVVFQRYSDRDDIITFNASRHFDSLKLNGNRRLTVSEVEMFIGTDDCVDKDYNVGVMLKNIAEMSKQEYWRA